MIPIRRPPSKTFVGYHLIQIEGVFSGATFPRRSRPPSASSPVACSPNPDPIGFCSVVIGVPLLLWMAVPIPQTLNRVILATFSGRRSPGSLPRSLSHGSRARSGRVEEMNYGIGNIAPERLSTPRQEKRIVLSPCRQEAWLYVRK